MRIPGDGRCLFRSLAQGRALQRNGSLLGSQQETLEADALRRDICCKLKEQRDMMQPFIEGDFDEYVTTMEHSNTWVRTHAVCCKEHTLSVGMFDDTCGKYTRAPDQGGEPELAVASHCVHSQVDVYVPVRACPSIIPPCVCLGHPHCVGV